MNIYQKLIEVRKSCEYLKKDASGDRFKYVSSSKTLGSLRAAMDEHGLLLVPSVIANEVRRHENNIYKKDDIAKKQYFTILEMSFTWINAEKPDEQVICLWTGHGLDDAEKGVGKAVTYAEKYFLLKFFNVATDNDDPDSHQKKNTPKPAPAQKKLVSFTEAQNSIKNAQSMEDLQSVWRLKGSRFNAELSVKEYKDVVQLKDARKAEFEMAK